VIFVCIFCIWMLVVFFVGWYVLLPRYCAVIVVVPGLDLFILCVNVPFRFVFVVALPLFISSFIVASGMVLFLLSVSFPVIVLVLFLVWVCSVIFVCIFCICNVVVAVVGWYMFSLDIF